MAKVCALDSLDPPLIAWQVHPLRERWKSALAATSVIALAAWLSALIMGQLAWGVFASGVLVIACNRFYFPTRYELTAEGITARFPLKTIRYRWVEIRRFVYDQNGGFLSRRARGSFLDDYQGISLLFPKDSGKVIQWIRDQLPRESIVREVMRKAALTKEGQAPCGG